MSDLFAVDRHGILANMSHMRVYVLYECSPSWFITFVLAIINHHDSMSRATLSHHAVLTQKFEDIGPPNCICTKDIEYMACRISVLVMTNLFIWCKSKYRDNVFIWINSCNEHLQQSEISPIHHNTALLKVYGYGRRMPII